MAQTPQIQSLVKALALLRCFKSSSPTHTIQELSDMLQIPKSSVHRILYTLQSEGYVEYDGRGNYSLSTVFLQFSSAALKGQSIRDISHDRLQQLSDRLGEAVYLQILDGINVVCLDEIQSKRFFSMSSKLGVTLPAYSVATGRMILSQLKKEQFYDLLSGVELKPMTPYTITKLDLLWQELQRISAQGYAFDNQEWEIGMCCLAVPIWDSTGRIVASFNMNANHARLNAETIPVYLPLLQEASKDISEKYGYIS